MKIQIGVGNKLIDRIALLFLIIVVLAVSALYYSYTYLLLPFYLALIFYTLAVRKKNYIFFEKNIFYIENAFKTECINAVQYESVSLAGFESLFANYCQIKFKDGRSFKFINDSKRVDELDKKIRGLIEPVQ